MCIRDRLSIDIINKSGNKLIEEIQNKTKNIDVKKTPQEIINVKVS